MSTKAAEVFYDKSLSLDERAKRLTGMAQAGDAEARGYLGSVAMLRRATVSDELPSVEFIKTLDRSVSDAAGSLEAAGGQPKESDLERELAEALERNLGPDLQLKTQYRLTLEGWPDVGRVDLAGLIPDSPPALIELKWGAGTLYNCAWDVLKLATALAEGKTNNAYLIAGAPSAEWGSGAIGAEIFSEQDDWRTAEFLAQHEAGFRKWRRDLTTRPQVVPNHFTVDPAEERWTLEIEGEPWEIRWTELMLALTSGWTQIDDEGRPSDLPSDRPAPKMQWEL